MHLITQLVHIIPCSVSAMNSNNGTNRIPRYCCPNHHKTSPMFHCWNQALWTVGFLGCSPNINSFWCREHHEGCITWSYHTFPDVWCPDFMVVTSSFTHPSIIFSDLILAIAALPWMLDVWSSRWTVFVETGSSRISSAAVVLWLYETILLHVWQSLSVNADFHSLFLFADVVFPWFMYTDTTLETVALDTPNMWQFLSQTLQLKVHQWSVLFQK
jgi:hypothetical protein